MCFCSQGETRPSDGCCVAKRCPKGWTQRDDYCYKFNLNEKDWADAEVACVAVGGNLASIHSKDHYDFVKGLIKTSAGPNKQTWVGGTDAVKEGVWLWSDGSKFDFTFWGPRQPDNAGMTAALIGFYFLGVANDMPCTQKKSYACGRGRCGRHTPATEGISGQM
uniref:C-type lectin domain-containing protein n=1 Tax=Monopterus albus TaxID=43700 RepID=A0A3Q3IDN7_MONAL